VERLAALWEAISWPDLPVRLALTPWQTLHNIASNAEALLFGQPHFFTPRPVNPLLLPRAAAQEVSFYDTTPMLFTLRRFADFSMINSRDIRTDDVDIAETLLVRRIGNGSIELTFPGLNGKF